jgi:3alpha(or 20beta)-hydroxysteroid dehydrogenase
MPEREIVSGPSGGSDGRTGGKLAGKTVVITGAAGGQGAAEAHAAAEAGAFVVATDILGETDSGVSHDGGPMAGEIVYRRLDVSSQADWLSLAEWLTRRGAGVDGLVNNAGIPMRGRLSDVSLEDWNQALAVNLTGPMLGIQAMLPLLNDGASIVNIGSVAGLTAHHAVAYTASKWALRGLSRVAAVEYGSRGIRSNIVHPGYIATPIMAAANPVFVDAHLALTPAGRAGTPDDIAPLVIYLLSDESRYVNGAEIAVDGGYASHGGTKYIIDELARDALTTRTSNT